MLAPSPALTFALRGTQALFALVVFGLSTSLIRGHHLGSLSSTLGFAAFAGGLSFVGAVLGVAGQWTAVLQGQIGVLVDAVVAGINIAGGILMAVKLKGVKCVAISQRDASGDWGKHTNAYKLVTSDIICGGARKQNDDLECWWYGKGGMLVSRCKMSQADSAFMFLTAIVVAAAAVIGFLRLKKGY
ncbi:uncharacterized protein EKO05_0004358 [Ascochyta rabiei]|uniref:uncharacterized protein n=1 Tax=Didymella rabiei TaxID=5454 RepID=UPI00220A24FB|nr:uncharacterized protein EKO05_0004358 [Ascochyta rabiei]UPX13861.1 hypothetical protein EKO05_0004358 [Ascochyta rabiei]